MPESFELLSPVDGRYGIKTEELREFLSEGALVFYRSFVELEWLSHLLSIDEIISFIPAADHKVLKKAKKQFAAMPRAELYTEVKAFEHVTKHDVKAVEYFLKKQLSDLGASERLLSLIHFACTSEDINNLAYGLMFSHARDQSLLPAMNGLIQQLAVMAKDYKDCAMLARTHGQSATPTSLGKELAVMGQRLFKQRAALAAVQIEAKMNGAVGNYNAHVFALPTVDWQKQSQDFVEKRLKLSWNPLTTQIENHDFISLYSDTLKRFNTIAIDLSRDLWTYISLGYFIQETAKNEVGSSTMPHKVNPIDFENAEGNFGLSSSLAEHFSSKLLISRLQRDLSDSTVLRSVSMMLAYHLIALKSLCGGLKKLKVSNARLNEDLAEAWELLAEPVQCVLRLHGISDAYEQLKDLSRGKKVDKVLLHKFIEQTNLPAAEKVRLKELAPVTYLGLASELTLRFSDKILKA